MVTKADLIRDIKALGIREDDVVTIHISLKAVGSVEAGDKTGAHTIIDALRSCVPKGLLLIPSHTWSNVRKEPVFDVRNTMPCVGALPGVAVQMANEAYDLGDRTCIRSMHPAHSVVAFGEDALAYTKDDIHACTPMPEFGSYRKLYTHKAKILLIGVPVERTTFIHAVDEYMKPDGISAPYPVTAIDYAGNAMVRQVCNCRPSAKTFGKYQPAMEAAGAISYGKLGQADVMVCDAVKTFDAIAAVWHELNPGV